MTTLEMAKQTARILDQKKAEEIQVIRVEDLTILAEYFVLASSDNATHVKALADEVEFQLKEQGKMPLHIEGYQYANWIVLDYGSVVVHIFHAQTREHYRLEQLWADGEQIDWMLTEDTASESK